MRQTPHRHASRNLTGNRSKVGAVTQREAEEYQEHSGLIFFVERTRDLDDAWLDQAYDGFRHEFCTILLPSWRNPLKGICRICEMPDEPLLSLGVHLESQPYDLAISKNPLIIALGLANRRRWIEFCVSRIEMADRPSW
jgi:hypothetical protein